MLGHQREARSASPNNCPNVGRSSQLIRKIKLKAAKGRPGGGGGGEAVLRAPNVLRSLPPPLLFGFSEGRTQLYGFESVLCARRGFQRSRSPRRSGDGANKEGGGGGGGGGEQRRPRFTTHSRMNPPLPSPPSPPPPGRGRGSRAVSRYACGDVRAARRRDYVFATSRR